MGSHQPPRKPAKDDKMKTGKKTLWVDGREVEILDRETLCGSGRLGVEA